MRKKEKKMKPSVFDMPLIYKLRHHFISFI